MREDEDFSDLMPLKALIGSARVVALGEQSHGDGSTFKAKCRLVRFLHQEMNFDVLAWESGLFDCRRVDEMFAKGVEPADVAKIAHEHGVSASGPRAPRPGRFWSTPRGR